MSLIEQLLAFMKEEAYRPLTKKELISQFSGNSTDRKILTKLLDDLEENGKIYKTKQDKYALPENLGLSVGHLLMSSNGYGFFRPEEKGLEDTFIPASKLNSAMHGDKIVIRTTASKRSRDKKEGHVVKVLERAISEVVGTIQVERNFGFVVPDDKHMNTDIFIQKKFLNGAKNGDLVLSKIIKYPQGRNHAEGKILRVIGKKSSSEAELLSILLRFHLPETFPPKVLAASERTERQVDPKEAEHRLDLRNELIFTIDGSDAKDLDDAISIQKTEQGTYLLGVHIADVSHYVKEDQSIDMEAVKRGNSTYLVDTVIPMLPVALSNGICSLHENVDRLTLSCIMEIDKVGTVHSARIEESIISSKKRFVYEEVSDFLEGKTTTNWGHDMEQSLQHAQELTRILIEKRKKRGNIDFDFPECKIEMKGKKVISVKKYERRIANRLIEQFMLEANETVAKKYQLLQVPFVFRVHETPDIERIQELRGLLNTFGYHLQDSGDTVEPKDFRAVLDLSEGKKEEHIIAFSILRAMKQARYAPDNLGHFGLAATHYTHFTSPIRRYSDLQIHRIIKEEIHHKLNEKRKAVLKKRVEEVSMQVSVTERNSEDAEREVEALRKAQYMQQFIGDEFDGIISSVVSFGFFVMLDNTVEGLVRLHTLDDDFYEKDEERYLLRGRTTGNVYHMGDKVRVMVDSVDLERKEIEFRLAKESKIHYD